jgi:hypothetical protein
MVQRWPAAVAELPDNVERYHVVLAWLYRGSSLGELKQNQFDAQLNAILL